MKTTTMLTWQTNYIQTFSICLASIAVIVCNFTTISAGTFHSSKTNDEKETEYASSNMEPLDQHAFTTYDQRQSGKYNFNVNIKDVKIIYSDKDEFEGSLDDDTNYEYGDYDYDPSHLTVSPLPIFGIGSVSLTSIKPPKSSTELPISIINYITKHTTEKPQPTAITNPPVTSNLMISTTGIRAPNPNAAMSLAEKQRFETHTLSSILSTHPSTSLFSKNDNFISK